MREGAGGLFPGGVETQDLRSQIRKNKEKEVEYK